jgi:hypothetical protein
MRWFKVIYAFVLAGSVTFYVLYSVKKGSITVTTALSSSVSRLGPVKPWSIGQTVSKLA